MRVQNTLNIARIKILNPSCYSPLCFFLVCAKKKTRCYPCLDYFNLDCCCPRCVATALLWLVALVVAALLWLATPATIVGFPDASPMGYCSCASGLLLVAACRGCLVQPTLACRGWFAGYCTYSGISL